MKKIVLLLTTVIMITFSGYGKTVHETDNVKNDKVEQTKSHDEHIVMFSHCQTVDLKTTTPLFPPIVMEWKIGGPVIFMEYKVRFKPTGDGTKMIISCDLVKKQ